LRAEQGFVLRHLPSHFMHKVGTIKAGSPTGEIRKRTYAARGNDLLTPAFHQGVLLRRCQN
jgi:hypothetical protein